MASHPPLSRFHFVDENDPERRHKSRAHLARELHRMRRQRWKKEPSMPRKTLLGSSRFDQFRWPLEVAIKAASPAVEIPSNLTASDQCLLHHYTVIMPELYKARWKLESDAPPVAMVPVTDLFQLYCRDEISFQAILFDAATHRSALQGKSAPLEYENRLLRAIGSNLNSLNIGVIIATALLCNIKCMDGSGGSSHWLGLMELVTMHGGIRAFKNDHLLFTKLIWSFIALPGPLTGFELTSDLEHGIRGLSDLLRSRQKAIVNLLPTSEEDMDRLADSKRIRSFKSSKLRGLFQPRSSEHPTERNCRISIIIFLTSALMQYGDFDIGTDFFIETIGRHLQAANDNASLSSPHLLWFTARLSNIHSIGDRFAELWIGVISMLNAFHRLKATTQEEVEILLFTSLEMAETFEEIPARWTLDGELKIEADDARQSRQDRSVPVECFCELLWFTEPPTE